MYIHTVWKESFVLVVNDTVLEARRHKSKSFCVFIWMS